MDEPKRMMEMDLGGIAVNVESLKSRDGTEVVSTQAVVAALKAFVDARDVQQLVIATSEPLPGAVDDYLSILGVEVCVNRYLPSGTMALMDMGAIDEAALRVSDVMEGER